MGSLYSSKEVASFTLARPNAQGVLGITSMVSLQCDLSSKLLAQVVLQPYSLWAHATRKVSLGPGWLAANLGFLRQYGVALLMLLHRLHSNSCGRLLMVTWWMLWKIHGCLLFLYSHGDQLRIAVPQHIIFGNGMSSCYGKFSPEMMNQILTW